MYEALADYIEKSEMRMADKNICIRMSPDLAEKYDDGVYNLAVSEHVGCVRELMALNLLPDKAKKVYIYIVPDDELVELLNYPYQCAESGGRPVPCFNRDGLRWAYGASQNTFILKKNSGVNNHVNDLHEYSHLIENEFRGRCLLFSEGFAELIPWYVLGYEDKSKTHIDAVLGTDIYTANDLLMNKNVFNDAVPNKTCSFQKSYISSYIFVRTLVKKIEQKFKVDKIGAVKIWLQWMAESGYDKTFLVIELAKKLGMDAEKLLETTDYQKEVLQKISNAVKIKRAIEKPMDNKR